MTKEQYKTKAGHTQFRPVMTQEEYSQEAVFSLNDKGFCLACGNEQDGVEPDACKRPCEGCGMSKVYGLEELMVMGLIRFETGLDAAVVSVEDFEG